MVDSRCPGPYSLTRGGAAPPTHTSCHPPPAPQPNPRLSKSTHSDRSTQPEPAVSPHVVRDSVRYALFEERSAALGGIGNIEPPELSGIRLTGHHDRLPGSEEPGRGRGSGMDPKARAELARSVMRALDDQRVSTVALTFVDNSGVTRVKTIPTARLPEAAVTGIGMSPVFELFGVDDSIAPEGSPVGDLRLIPDLERITPLAAQPGLAWSPVDRYTQDGEPYPRCQRTFARSMTSAALDRGLEVKMGFEVEWVIGNEDSDGNLVPACRGPAYGMDRVLELGHYVTDLQQALASEGIVVLQIHPEYGPGQFEVSVAPADPVTAADNAVLVRETIRSIGYAHALRSSFAPVVIAGQVGNGGHLHVSLRRGAANAFASGDGPYGLTNEAEAFMSSVLAELPALVAIGAPSVASYSRLVPSHWAGAYACWGLENREAAIRLVTGAPGERDRIANVEIKCFDLSANPYLVVGAVLAAGLNGIDRGGRLPEPISVDPASLSDDERRALGVSRLPQRLEDALDHLSKAELLAEAMGRPLLGSFLAVRRAEIESFAGASDDEIVSKTRWRY